jgi:hypothetical protein
MRVVTRFAGYVLMGCLVGCASSSPPPAPAKTNAKPAQADEEEDVPSACASGVEQTEASSCGTIARGLCFTKEVEACACMGCPAGKCATSFSFPPQAVCE